MNPIWHDELEGAHSVDEAVAAVRRYLGSLPLRDLDRLPRWCDAKKIRCDDDVDDLTFKLSQWQRDVDVGARHAVSDAFGILLHASLRISRLNRQRVHDASPSPHTGSGFVLRQMH